MVWASFSALPRVRFIGLAPHTSTTLRSQVRRVRTAAGRPAVLAAQAMSQQDSRRLQSVTAGDRQVSKMKDLSGGQVVFEMLRARGVDTVFGYSGGAVLPLIDAFHGKDIKFITSAHEQCSGHSATAYSKATGKLGVVVVTSGPGITNLITPIQDAYSDGVPLVILSGQVPTSAMGTDAFQECPAVDITQSCTKWSYVCHTMNDLPWAMKEAFRIATSGRPGPVHVDLPKDVVSSVAKVPGAVFAQAEQQLADPPPIVDLKAIEKAAAMINQAKQPVFYVGQGAMNCPELMRSIVQKTQIPVTTTLHAMGIFDERDPLSLHMLGMHGAAYANFAIQNADVIVAVGSRFDDRTTGVVAKYAPKARAAESAGTGGIIHINIDKFSFGKVVQATVPIWADCEHALTALDELLVPSESLERKNWLAQCQDWKADHPFGYVKPSGGKIKTQMVIEAINTYLQKSGTIDKKEVQFATGVGNHQMMSCQFLRWVRPRSMLSSGSAGVMGVGLPFAIGAQVAKPDALTILIDGDGSFNMTNMDLSTIKRYQLPVKIAIMNDSRQQMVWIWQRLFFEGRYLSVDNVNPDYVRMAKAYGIEALRCDNEEDLPKVIEQWLNHDGPMLVDFKVVPDICLPMVAPGKALDEMILLEDREAIFGKSEDELGNMKFVGEAPS